MFFPASFCRTERLGFAFLSFFCGGFLFFIGLHSWRNFEGQFGVHKTAHQQFKLVFEGLKFWPIFASNLNILNENLYRNTIKIGFQAKWGKQNMCQKWPIWKAVRGPQGGQFRDHIRVSFSDLHGGPLTACSVGPELPFKRLLSAERNVFFTFCGPRTGFLGRC